MSLHDLRPAKGAVRERKRVGRGPGTGLGKTSGRGEMPLHRRVPKRGFNNKWRKEYEAVNLEKLTIFDAGTIVTPELLLKRGMIKKLRDGLKVLGDGELKQAITVRAH